MNQHVDRRALLLSSSAAAAALAAVAAAREVQAADRQSIDAKGAATAEHRDAELFRLEAEMEAASARMKKIWRAQKRLSNKAEKATGTRPLHPTDWKAPAMPDDLLEMHQAALNQATFADVRDGKRWQPAPVAAWQEAVDQERAMVQATWDEYCEKKAEEYRLVNYDAKEAEFNAACDEEWQLGMRILAVPAHTLEGIMVKIRVGDRLHIEDFAENDVYVSIVADVRRLAGQEGECGSATVVVPSASVQIPQDEVLYAYSEWLHFERLALMREMHPSQNPHEAMWYVPCNTLSQGFHFPPHESDLTWETMPQPGTRALAVMTTAGVDLHERYRSVMAVN
jgi:hypothetical protein